MEREARKVHISSLELECLDSNEEEQEVPLPQLPAFGLQIECGGGTYVRTLIEDIARAAGSGAHMTALTRTKQGPFSLEDCLNEEDSKDAEAIMRHIETCKARLAAAH